MKKMGSHRYRVALGVAAVNGGRKWQSIANKELKLDRTNTDFTIPAPRQANQHVQHAGQQPDKVSSLFGLHDMANKIQGPSQDHQEEYAHGEKRFLGGAKVACLQTWIQRKVRCH